MAETFEWSKETYERSVTCSCWWYTAYDAGWDDSAKYDHDLRKDAECARSSARKRCCVRCPTGRGNRPRYDPAYPAVRTPHVPGGISPVVDAIGAQCPATFNYTCYTADASRKREAMDYCFCLDAWLAGVSADSTAAELNGLGCLRLDWGTVCGELWRVLGQHTEKKDLLVRAHSFNYAGGSSCLSGPGISRRSSHGTSIWETMPGTNRLPLPTATRSCVRRPSCLTALPACGNWRLNWNAVAETGNGLRVSSARWTG